MTENENLVTEVTENVEQTTEETQPTAKTYTQEEVDAIVGKSKARATAKAKKEFDRELSKYKNLENVLRVGTGKESVDEMTDTFTKFYESKGFTFPEQHSYSDRDNEILARAEAKEIIDMGYDEVVEEVDRLASLGVENMTPRDKAYFKELAEYRKNTERQGELSKIGVSEDVYNSKEFQDFASKFNSSTPIADIYNIYNKTTQPKKDIKPMGSMKQTPLDDTGVKDYYSFEEASKFTEADFDKNPALYEAVTKSMHKWK